MTYRPGDLVFPADLPRRFVCRVIQAEPTDVSSAHWQILKLEPLEGPWPSGTALIRLDSAVLPVGARGLWQRPPAPRDVDSTRSRHPRRVAA